VAASGGKEDALPYRAHKHALVRRQARLVHFFSFKTSPKVLDIVSLYVVNVLAHLRLRIGGKKRFMKKNPSGMLPVVEIDGQMMSDSIRIMQVFVYGSSCACIVSRGKRL
jgi:hypothetical protein